MHFEAIKHGVLGFNILNKSLFWRAQIQLSVEKNKIETFSQMVNWK